MAANFDTSRIPESFMFGDGIDWTSPLRETKMLGYAGQHRRPGPPGRGCRPCSTTPAPGTLLSLPQLTASAVPSPKLPELVLIFVSVELYCAPYVKGSTPPPPPVVPSQRRDVVRHRLSRAGDRQLNYCLHIMAISQIRQDTPGKEYYLRKRSHGKGHNEAMRCLKRRLPDVVYRQLVNVAATMAAGPEGHSRTTLMSSAAS
jgi:hypothetical protein